MTKPTSELIALADEHATREEVLALAINNELCRQIDAGEKMDSLRVTSKIVALPIVQGLLAATPPAQPAQVSTHTDGAVREALSALVDVVSNMRVPQNVADAALQVTIIGSVLERAKAVLHSPKIAAAETSPGDGAEKVDWTPFEDGTAPWPEDEQFEERAKACKSRCKQYGYTCGQGGEEDYEYEGECDDCDRDAQEVLRKKYLKPAANRLDVKAEAKSQEPEAWMVKPLEWESAFSVGITSYRATAIGIRYYVYLEKDDELWHAYTEGYQHASFAPTRTLDDAKAAAQADYEQRIRSALISTTKPPAVSVDAIYCAIRDAAMSLPPSDFGSHRAIEAATADHTNLDAKQSALDKMAGAQEAEARIRAAANGGKQP